MDQLELQYYEAQLELYDIKFEILKNEELLLVAQIDTVRRQMKGINAKKHTHRHTLTHTHTYVHIWTCYAKSRIRHLLAESGLRDNLPK